jgi:hypothetical protein
VAAGIDAGLRGREDVAGISRRMPLTIWLGVELALGVAQLLRPRAQPIACMLS